MLRRYIHTYGEVWLNKLRNIIYFISSSFVEIRIQYPVYITYCRNIKSSMPFRTQPNSAFCLGTEREPKWYWSTKGKQKPHKSHSDRKKTLTSKKATAREPSITKAEFSTAHSIREMDRPPNSVNFSMSERLVKDALKPGRNN